MQTEKRVIALGFLTASIWAMGPCCAGWGRRPQSWGAVPAAVTFDTHPENLILKTPAVPLLSSPLDRAELMRRFYGIREVIVAHFDERMMHALAGIRHRLSGGGAWGGAPGGRP